MVFDENFFDEIDHFHPNFDESVPNPSFPTTTPHPVHAPVFGCVWLFHIFHVVTLDSEVDSGQYSTHPWSLTVGVCLA